MSQLEIRRLVPSDAEAWVELRREALEREPLAFLSSPEDENALDASRVRERLADPTAATFGAFAPQLVGSVGIYGDPHRKARHKGHVWGMYVRGEARGAGAGRALLRAALDFARELGAGQVHLSVGERAAAAARLYESAGFQRWGTEPDALRHAGERIAEHHLVLRLEP